MRLLFATLLITTYCQAQEFDRVMERNVRTEINLNRIARSHNRIDRHTADQVMCDSLNMKYFKRCQASIHETSRGVKKDFRKMHELMSDEMDKDETVNYNFFVIDNADEYRQDLKEMIHEKDAYFYRMTTSNITLSVIRFNDKLFVTILSD